MAETNKVEVVISGIAGIFPESDNVEELRNLLFSKQNGITLDSRRWPLDEYGISSGVGKLKSINKFDNVFFNMHGKLCQCSEPMIKLCLERFVEAIVDAGINPGDLYDTNTAVFSCSSVSESDSIAMFDESKSGLSIVGHNKAMQANRLSYALNLNGPSFTIHSSFTGGIDALVMAKNMIEKGHIRTALIGGSNLVQRPNISLQMKGLGILNDGVETRSFSDDADGFNRSESCVALLLQNSLDAKRSYGTLMCVKMEQFGDLRGVFTNYSTQHYKKIIMEAYKEAGIDPASVAYIEADGCGIKNVDALELNVIKEVFCSTRRKESILVGSIKSNLGHTDAASGLVSMIKAIIAMDGGYIPPNINYTKPNTETDALTSEKVKIVTEITPLKGDIIGLNIFGRTGNYGHIILKRFSKQKKRIYKKEEIFDDGLPRLILVSGRSEKGVLQNVKMIESYNVDEEYVALLHSVFSKNISAHFFRSFFIIPTPNSRREKDIYPITNEKPPVWFVFSGMGSQWLGMGLQLLKIPIFTKAIHKCDAVLKPMGLDIFDIITSLDSILFDNILHAFVGISAVQIGLVDILKALDIEPDGMIGHSVGELGCAYADGCFTTEEMIMAAYVRGRASVETPLPSGMMAVIGLGYNSIKSRLPHDIDVACHNSSENCTISGPTRSVIEFVEKLKSEKIFSKTVNVSNISFHSRYIQPAAPILLKYLNQILPSPKLRSSRWLSSSIPESMWDTDLAKFSSAEYHTNNLLSPVLFEETCKHIPKNAVVIEIAPHGLLQAILKRSLSEMINIPLTQRVFGDSVKFLLTAIGKIYVSGLNPNIEMLYEPVSFPVSCNTPPLHTLCSWNHTEDWSLIDLEVLIKKTKGEKLISLSPNINNTIEEYEILGRHVLPLSALLFYTWESFIQLRNNTEIDIPVMFEDIQYHQHIVINKIQSSNLCSSIQAGTGRFELCLDNTIILSGNIFVLDDKNFSKNKTVHQEKNKNTSVLLTPEEVYLGLEQFGYCVGDVFKTIKRVDIFEDELRSQISWDSNWIHFLDALIQLPTAYEMEKRGELVVPVSIQSICINPLELNNQEFDALSVQYNIFTNEVVSTGVKFSGLRFEMLPLDPLVKTLFHFNEQYLVNLKNPNFNKPIDFVKTSMDLVLEFKQCDDFENAFVCPVFNSQDQTMRHYTNYILETKSSEVEILIVDKDFTQLNSYSDNSQYIGITHNENLSSAMLLFSNKSHVHLVVYSSSQIHDSNEYVVVLQQKFGENYFALMKKILKIDKDNVIIHSLTINNINNSGQFQNILNNLKSLNKTIYVVSKIQPSEGILSIVKKLDKLKNIRFYFVLDVSAPDFNTSSPFYSNQLSKDILLNVYKNGEWITYKEMDFINTSNTQVAVQKTLFANLSHTTFKNVSVKYIGLNPQDTKIETKNNNVEYEIGPIEYSGLTSRGTMIMGVAPFTPTVTDIIADPILSWTVPKNMSLEEASTIPLPYSIAYYLLDILSKISEHDFVLVHAGLTAVGQAAINICLEKKCHVFVTVADSKQMELLKQNFPLLPCSNILIFNKDNFEIKFLMNKNKMNIIINCLDGEEFHATLRVIAPHGKFFQLTKSDMKKKYKMGLSKFLDSLSFYAIGMERILIESEECKKKIQSAIEKGLQNGTVRAFDRCLLTGTCTGSEALKTLEKLTRENEFKRVVMPISKVNCVGNKTQQFQCCPDKIYFVIGNGSNDWLYLIEWLAQRGALKLVVALEKYALTPKVSRKLNIIIDRFKGISVQLVSQSLLGSEVSASKLFNDSVTKYPLAAVFFVNHIDERIIENMQNAVNQVSKKYDHKPLFMCLFCGGAISCDNLKSVGVNALCLSWTQTNPTPKLVKILPTLDNLILKSELITNAVVMCSEFTADQQINSEVYLKDNKVLLPNTLDELERISKYIVRNPEFVEVATKSVLYADAKGAYPVFVMPGFRPDNMKNLYNNLGYPTFEARYPAKFQSIISVAEVLVKKIKQITDYNAVTLIGESWGGAVALVMAQILESEGVLVSLSLLNGVPSTLLEWANENLILNNNMNATLLSRYVPIDDEIANNILSQKEWDANITKLLQLNNVSEISGVCDTLNMIQTQLNTLMTLEPLHNKLLAVPHVFISSELSASSTDILNEFCNNSFVIHIIVKANSQSLLEDSTVIQTINENVAFYYPYSLSKSLDDEYNQHYYKNEVQLVC